MTAKMKFLILYLWDDFMIKYDILITVIMIVFKSTNNNPIIQIPSIQTIVVFMGRTTSSALEK